MTAMVGFFSEITPVLENPRVFLRVRLPSLPPLSTDRVDALSLVDVLSRDASRRAPHFLPAKKS